MKRKEGVHAIDCNSYYGPRFHNQGACDLCIDDNCHNENKNYICNDGTHGYECHPEYKSSLFVNTAGPEDENNFYVLDYEVFGINNITERIKFELCKYPSFIWDYIETNYIYEYFLNKFDNDIELLRFLDAHEVNNENSSLKISSSFLKNPSKYLPGTQIVNEQYDNYLKKWVGDYDWRLIYRASEHGYTARSFHNYCDNRGPTLIIIKSSGGWIFGGYTTQSWEKWGIYNDMI